MNPRDLGAVQPRPSAHFITLGCPKNEVDTERMRSVLHAAGYRLAEDLDSADVAILNTCGFISAAVEESIEEALDLAEWRDALPGRKLVLAGCMVSRYQAELDSQLPEIDVFVPVADERNLALVLDDVLGRTHRDPGEAIGAPLRISSGPSAYLQLSDGCHRACAYCTIPAIRGPYRSRPLDEIVAEAKQLISLGARELVLIGQDISAYGRDLPDGTLSDVLRALCAIEGVAWIRLMYVQPDGVSDELLQTIASQPVICNYLDIPLQHASRSVLRSMRRSGSGPDFLALIGRIRDVLPDVALRTTFIAGYPGETREDVRELLDFVEKARFNYVGVFPYSPEEGTEAVTLPGLPDKRTRIRRAQKVRDVADAIGIELAAQKIGRTLEVLAEGLDEDGTPVGRWRGQAPEIDGVVLLDREVRAGEIVNVEIVDTLGYDLEGKVRTR